MRILLAQNSHYFPAHGGGDKSNRLLLEALAARGHSCEAVARISELGEAGERRYLDDLASRGVNPTVNAGIVSFERTAVSVHVATNTHLRGFLASRIEAFHPDVILASTDDPAQLLLEAALRDSHARVVYLVRATLAVPFGPDCAFPSEARTERIRAADAVVGVSEYVASYIRKHAAIDAVHVPISLLEPGEWRNLGRFDNEFVTLVNPCAVKGISIFLGLADVFPAILFAAVPTWGTNEQDRAALQARPNIRVLDPVDNIDLILERTRILLVPSLWAEARSRIVLEAMLRGVPVVAADVGGIGEAKMGVPYLLPVAPIQHYESRVDEQMVPVADVPPQDIRPWCQALSRLLTDPDHFAEISRASRDAAILYASSLNAGPFERILLDTLDKPKRASQPHEPPRSAGDTLSPEKRRLLALRLRQKAAPSAWFPGADKVEVPRLFWFPHAGGGASPQSSTDLPMAICPVRLPGRESRLAEAPFERMAPLVEALANAIEPYLSQPFAFFGHSMGAAIAFELTRLLRARGLPMPKILIASAARAPHFRRNHVPPPAPADDQFIEELRRLEGIPAEVLDDPALMRALLPALKADAALYRNYVYSEDRPLEIPVRAYGGASDPNVKLEHLEGWGSETFALFLVRLFPGGHFYLRSAGAEFRAALKEDLE